jgi:hypothetical protein
MERKDLDSSICLSLVVYEILRYVMCALLLFLACDSFFVCFFGNCCVVSDVVFLGAKIINNKIITHNRTNIYKMGLFRGCRTLIIALVLLSSFSKLNIT